MKFISLALFVALFASVSAQSVDVSVPATNVTTNGTVSTNGTQPINGTQVCVNGTCVTTKGNSNGAYSVASASIFTIASVLTYALI